MGKVIKITESVYKDLISEEMHYPRFLDGTISKVTHLVYGCIRQMVKKRETETSITPDLGDTPYFERLNIQVRIKYDAEIDKKRFYGAYSISNERLVNGKTGLCQIELEIPISEDGKTNYNFIMTMISHEITHLYDDWVDLTNGGNGLFNRQSVVANTELFYDNHSSPNRLLKAISWMCYMSNYTETNAFTTQIMYELKELKCDVSNIREKYKEATSFTNLNYTLQDFHEGFENIFDEDLEDLNTYILETYPKSNVPKMNIGAFDAGRYRSMLEKWFDRESRKIRRRFMCVVQLYRDELAENYIRRNSIPIHF